MEHWGHINCCKTIGCSFFGVVNSPHYKFKEGNYHCPECSQVFPFISPAALAAFTLHSNKYYPGIFHFCPGCRQSRTLIRHGQSANGHLRWYCRACDFSFTSYKLTAAAEKKSEPLRKAIATGELHSYAEKKTSGIRSDMVHLSFLARLAQAKIRFTSLEASFSTATFTVSYNNSHNQLYVIITADNNTGCIIAVTTNYLPEKHSVPSEWWYAHTIAEQFRSNNIITNIFDKDRMISRRSVLFNISYGPATLKRNDPGAIIKPVLAAYRHFDIVHTLTHRHILYAYHWLEHECFLYGACLMANLRDVLDKRTQISFVYEYGVPDRSKRLQSQIINSDIIWNDVWRCYSQKGYELALCHLTAVNNKPLYHLATLNPARRFHHYLTNHPVYPQLIRLTPGNIGHLLEHLIAEYNQLLPESVIN